MICRLCHLGKWILSWTNGTKDWVTGRTRLPCREGLSKLRDKLYAFYFDCQCKKISAEAPQMSELCARLTENEKMVLWILLRWVLLLRSLQTEWKLSQESVFKSPSCFSWQKVANLQGIRKQMTGQNGSRWQSHNNYPSRSQIDAHFYEKSIMFLSTVQSTSKAITVCSVNFTFIFNNP